MAKKKYRVLAGTHQNEGKGPIYKRGQVVESEFDLVAAFGKSKFERVGKFVQDEEVEEPAAAAASSDADVTSDFAVANETEGITVVKRDGKFHILDNGKEVAGPLSKAKVNKAVESYLDSLDEEGDDE